jgi:hypothetical protein
LQAEKKYKTRKINKKKEELEYKGTRDVNLQGFCGGGIDFSNLVEQIDNFFQKNTKTCTFQLTPKQLFFNTNGERPKICGANFPPPPN